MLKNITRLFIDQFLLKGLYILASSCLDVCIILILKIKKNTLERYTTFDKKVTSALRWQMCSQTGCFIAQRSRQEFRRRTQICILRATMLCKSMQIYAALYPKNRWMNIFLDVLLSRFYPVNRLHYVLSE